MGIYIHDKKEEQGGHYVVLSCIEQYRAGQSNFYQPDCGITPLSDCADAEIIGSDMVTSSPITSGFWAVKVTQQVQLAGGSDGGSRAFLSSCSIVPTSPSPKGEARTAQQEDWKPLKWEEMVDDGWSGDLQEHQKGQPTGCILDHPSILWMLWALVSRNLHFHFHHIHVMVVGGTYQRVPAIHFTQD